ncbi:hypothetical protein GCM10009605_43630 [Nocardiopsis composta]
MRAVARCGRLALSARPRRSRPASGSASPSFPGPFPLPGGAVASGGPGRGDEAGPDVVEDGTPPTPRNRDGGAEGAAHGPPPPRLPLAGPLGAHGGGAGINARGGA